jgi:hypothetical protein
MSKKYRPWRLISWRPSDKVVTRDGREVVKMEVINDPKESLWATQVTTKDPENKRRRVTYIVNHNGRRYANIKTGDDILVELPVKESKPREHDCMPDVMAAIAAAKERDIAAIRLANKSSSYYSQVGSVDRIYIGVNSD